MVSYGQIHLKTASFYRKNFHWQKVDFEASKSERHGIVSGDCGEEPQIAGS